MNWSAVTAIISTLTLLVVIISWAHFSGRWKQTLEHHGEKISELDSRVTGTERHLGRVDVTVAKLEQYQEGFTTAAKVMAARRNDDESTD